MADPKFPSLTELNNNLQQIARNILLLLNALTGAFVNLTANNAFTGNNTFTGTTAFEGPTSFDPPPTVGAGAVGTATIEPEGALSNQFSVAGVGNGANTTDDTLFTYTLPAHSLDNAGRAVLIDAYGKFASNGNNKTVKIFFGTTLVFSSGVLTTNGGGWTARLLVTKTGASAQIGAGGGVAGSAAMPVPVPLVGSETDTGAIVIKITGASPTTGAANDVVGNGMLTRFIN